MNVLVVAVVPALITAVASITAALITVRGNRRKGEPKRRRRRR